MNKKLFLIIGITTFLLAFCLKETLCQAPKQTKNLTVNSFTEREQIGSFVVKKSLFIPELNCQLTELVCTKNGAEIVHIGNDDPENMFSISFRTYPTSSNGAPHILEHTTLKGSKKYPTGNPFQELTRKSLKTYMNASTYPDFTCYYAASKIEKDFYNLFDVYLDAAFHPTLTEKCFSEEGWRLEFQNIDDKNNPSHLSYKGVVYNEMKGVFASPIRRAVYACSEALFPDSPYRFISGGHPREIPKLSHEALCSYYKTFYTPNNCTFYFYGNLPLAKHLEFLETHFVPFVEERAPRPELIQQKPLREPVVRFVEYPAAKDEKTGNNNDIITISWATCQLKNRKEFLALAILDSCLMDTDASLLAKEVMEAKLATQIRSYLDTTNAQSTLTLFLEGTNKDSQKAIDTLVQNTLKKIAKDGLPKQLVENAINLLELEWNEIDAGSSPFGESLFIRTIPVKQHGGDVEETLCLSRLFDDLRKTLQKNERYLEEMLERYLINNSHKATIVLSPSAQKLESETKEEEKELALLEKNLTTAEKQLLLQKQENLIAQNAKKEQANVPSVTLQDVPKEIQKFSLIKKEHPHFTSFYHEAFTNHLTYISCALTPSILQPEDAWIASLYTTLIPELGTQNRTWQENLEYIHTHTGGIWATFSLHKELGKEHAFTPKLYIKSVALDRKQEEMTKILLEIAYKADFSDKERLRDLVFKHYTNLQNSLSQSAIRYAMSSCLACQSPFNLLSDSTSGVRYFQAIRTLCENYAEKEEELIQKLTTLQKELLKTSPDLIVTCEKSAFKTLQKNNFYAFSEISPSKKPELSTSALSPLLPEIQSCAYQIPAAVSFNACGFFVPSCSAETAVKLALTAELLTSTTLHDTIREKGGAYGAGAGFSYPNANFYLYSYRDPNIASTKEAFDEAIQKLMQESVTEEQLENAKLVLLQNLDKPLGVSKRAEFAYACLLEKRTDQIRQTQRDTLLHLTAQDVMTMSQTIINPHVQKAPFVSFTGLSLLEKENPKLPQPLDLKQL